MPDVQATAAVKRLLINKFPQADHRLGEAFWGLREAPAAFRFTPYDRLPSASRLSGLLVPERWRGRHAGWESPDRQRRVFTQDRTSLRLLAASELAAGRHTSSRRAMHLHNNLTRHTENLANVFFDSRVRDCFGSHVLAAVEAVAPGTPVFFYTLMSLAWRTPVGGVDPFTPSDLTEALRQQLYRAGLERLSGWCILSLHGEHRLDGSVDLHVHAVVVGDKALAFEALRDLPQFQGGRGALIEEPIQREEARHPVRQINYLFQHDWSFKTDYDTESETFGERGRRRPPARVAHGRYLIWRARQRFSDLTWMHAIRPRGGRLRPDDKT